MHLTTVSYYLLEIRVLVVVLKNTATNGLLISFFQEVTSLPFRVG